ncbi:MAG: bifunctional folylpolyglutamate synthase/dihydrofolate synthase [Sphingomonadaceae bacterium]|nr:bifunctional folylpolyglutamate synthase/dihydrofolate synthase [Sphingomonadaceae bacterium]NBU78506.1 bifunctional folylpolyglutamate synthase/dihydrofolate synthase [Sphingomonadaceae bacterium]NCA02121.1 bifunctional folylpolyglutamate synthase/dihydrofolate synthase [Sphingomonadaceae bacterium]
MADHARSDNPAVQAQLDRFAQLSPGRDILGLERIAQLLAAIGNPQDQLPPVFHVAGTNGKGSTCAFLRAAVESAGLTAHVYTSPHLVRFNERIRVAGRLIEDDALAASLKEVLDAAEQADIGPSFFEATTAAAFLAFARTPADVAIIEVGLGGRLDATNIIASPVMTGIAQLGLDHEAFLLDPSNGPAFPPLERIGYEKAGIAKASAPMVTMDYPPAVAARVEDVAAAAGTQVVARKSDWDCAVYQGQLHYRDAQGKLSLPLPRLAGAHQAENAGLAVAMLRHQSRITISDSALRAAMGWAHWPARMQVLANGPLKALIPSARTLWLDGGHNPNAATMIAQFFANGDKVDLVLGMLANKDAQGFLRLVTPIARSVTSVPIPGHDCHSPQDLCAMAQSMGIADTAMASDLADALRQIDAKSTGSPSDVAILGSLYLAGVALAENNQLPD